MRKTRTTSFHGAWKNGTIPVELLRARLRNEMAACIDPAPVLAALSRQMEEWRFNLEWQDADPQPGQWAELLLKIRVPDVPDYCEVADIGHSLRALPAFVIGVMSGELFKRADVGTATLLERMRNDAIDTGAASPDDANLLRGVVADMVAGLAYVKGKRGPKLKRDIGPTIRAVHAAIVANSTMGDVPARELAADLLIICGIPAPTSRSRLAELFSRAD